MFVGPNKNVAHTELKKENDIDSKLFKQEKIDNIITLWKN
jgi:hypothetical protein